MFRKWFVLLAFIVPSVSVAQSIDLLILNKNYCEALVQIEQQLADSNATITADAELYFKQASVYRQLSEHLKAVKSLENAMAIDTASSKYLNEYADLQAELGDFYHAIEFYRRAVLHSPDDLNLKYKLGRTYLYIEDFQRAFDVCQLIREKDSVNVIYNKQFAFTALKTAKKDMAIRVFESVIQQNTGDFSSYLNLISLYSKTKNTAEIIRVSEKALSIFPDNPTILLREAIALFSLSEYEKAKNPFESYLTHNDSVFDVLKNYGITLYFCKNEEKSIELLEKCFYQVPNDQYVNFYLGIAYKNLAKYTRSAEFLNMAVASAQPPYLSEMYHHLGQVYGYNREFEKSIAALQKAYDSNPEKVEVLFEIATTYEEFSHNKNLALNYYSSYLKAAGDNAQNAVYALERIKKIKELSNLKK